MNEPLLQITAHSQIFILTRAGIRKESGIQTLQDSADLRNTQRRAEVESTEGF